MCFCGTAAEDSRHFIVSCLTDIWQPKAGRLFRVCDQSTKKCTIMTLIFEFVIDSIFNVVAMNECDALGDEFVDLSRITKST